jgi:hypothetical protein
MKNGLTSLLGTNLLLLPVVCGLFGCDSKSPRADSGADADEAPIRVESDAFTGWIGGSCSVNKDCHQSPAARGISTERCADEIYCLGGVCYAACTKMCAVVRSDVDPCPPPRLCVHFAVSSVSLCKITPVECTLATDCPLARPPSADGGQAEWSCEDGICRYPGFEYATR